MSEHIPAPSEHAPNRNQSDTPSGKLLVWEESNQTAWIESDYAVEVVQ